MTFKALVVKKGPDGTARAVAKALTHADLPPSEVSVHAYPQVLGMDVACTLEVRGDARYAPGDKVVLPCVRLGEALRGGYAQKACQGRLAGALA